MTGVNSVDDRSCDGKQLQTIPQHDSGIVASPATIDTTSIVSEIGLDGGKLAKTILLQAFADAKLNPYGRGENERFNQDKERIVEVIGEAQWYLLDDNDEDVAFGYHWCCSLLRLDPSALRRNTLRLLKESDVLISRSDRYRFAEIAGKRRLRLNFQKVSRKRQACSTEGCGRLTMGTICKWCLVAPEGEQLQSLPCSKCQTPLQVVLKNARKPYCLPCSSLCVRPGCQEPRRTSSRATICREHHRTERRTGKLGDKNGKPYMRPTAVVV